MKTKLKIFLSFTLLAVVIFAAVPKVYIHNFLGHDHGFVQSTSETALDELGDNQDCNFEKFDTPIYFTVFKFILNFLPLKESKQTSFFYHQKSIPQLQYNTSFLRGPPMA